jgi:SDR family mycofactocin-dependent oxidoreductase
VPWGKMILSASPGQMRIVPPSSRNVDRLGLLVAMVQEAMAMAGRLEGKVAFITGAARGQGRSHAVRFAAEGADIIGVDICADIPDVGYPLATRADLDDTVAMVETLDRRMVAGVGDVRDRESLRKVLDEGLAELGHLDFVLANAGIMPTRGDHANELRAWHDTLGVVLTGVMHTVELTYPRLIAQGHGGAIVITGSMAAVEPMMRTEHGKTLGLLGYAAAKAALVNLMRNYASILAVHGIRVNVIQPTGVNTPMINNRMMEEHWATQTEQDGLALVNALPVRVVEPIDISNAMLWLCSEEGRYMTGSAIRVDAGANLR